MTIYFLALFNLLFLVALFFIFRHYIRRELGKVEYIRLVERELRLLLLEIHRSAEDITQVLEDRLRQLRELSPPEIKDAEPKNENDKDYF